MTVRGWFQFEVVNAKLPGTVTAPVSPEDSVTVTALLGCVASRSV